MNTIHNPQMHVTHHMDTVNPGAGDMPIHVRRLRLDELDEAFALTREQLDASVAEDDRVRHVLGHNPESFWGVFRREEETSQPRLIGYLGFLLLNEAGAAALKSGTL